MSLMRRELSMLMLVSMTSMSLAGCAPVINEQKANSMAVKELSDELKELLRACDTISNEGNKVDKDKLFDQVAQRTCNSFISPWSDDPVFDNLYSCIHRNNQVPRLIKLLEDKRQKGSAIQRELILLACVYLDEYRLNDYLKVIDLIDRSALLERMWLKSELMIKAGKFDKALPLTDCLASKTCTGKAYANSATALLMKGHRAEALQANIKAKSLNPFFPQTHLNDALLCLHRKQYQQALEEVEFSLQGRPRDWLTLYTKLKILICSGKMQEAQALATKLGFGERGSPSFNRKWVDTLLETRKPAEALEYLQECIVKDPQDPYHILRKAEIEFALWLYEDAIKDCDRALKLNAACTPAAKLKLRVQTVMQQSLRKGGIKALTQSLTAVPSKKAQSRAEKQP